MQGSRKEDVRRDQEEEDIQLGFPGDANCPQPLSPKTNTNYNPRQWALSAALCIDKGREQAVCPSVGVGGLSPGPSSAQNPEGLWASEPLSPHQRTQEGSGERSWEREGRSLCLVPYPTPCGILGGLEGTLPWWDSHTSEPSNHPTTAPSLAGWGGPEKLCSWPGRGPENPRVPMTWPRPHCNTQSTGRR